YDLPEGAPVVDGVRLPIVLGFLLATLTFVPLGQLLAQRLQRFQQEGKTLWGYSWDILGSLAGVLAFSAFALAATPPLVWFLVFLGAGAFLLLRHRRAPLFLALAAAAVLVVALAERNETYSPYYALRTEAGPLLHGVRVLTNGSLHQYGVSMDSTLPAASERHARIREGYRLPYELLDRPPGRVLVLGAGTGNDVATALAAGAESVDAVEIDPSIAEIGRQLHPDRPYSDPRVRLFTTDARSFLNENEEKYDLIVFGTLDSMTRLSALSNVRLDNFVYTRESLQAARDHLAPDGGLALYFMVARPYISQRLTGIMLEVFDTFPFLVEEHFHLFNTLLMTGPAFADYGAEPRAELAQQFRTNITPHLELPGDDWPFLYLEDRAISSFYLSLIAILSLLAAAMVWFASPQLRQSLRAGRGPDGPMFLFGAGFLLLETRSVTAVNLAWGATWLTSAVVFGCILLTIYLATVATALRPISLRGVSVGLALSLLIAWAVPVETLLSFDTVGRLALTLLLVGAPIFFASVGFARIFAARSDAAVAFGWNVLGAVAGGLLEFLSMITGFRALLLVAFALYALALFLAFRQGVDGEQKSEPNSEATDTVILDKTVNLDEGETTSA
ncbi:MAG: hypothetical protein AAGD01_06275, partial [Acidobacteriota bacterium]